MYPPIKTRLVGTLTGWGPAGTREVAGAPGEAVAGMMEVQRRQTSREPCCGVLSSLYGWGNLGSSWGWPSQDIHPAPTPSSIALKNQEPFAF